MIQANELRVGNWVIYNGKAYQIDTISPELPILDADFGVGVVDYNNIHGIPLTPEILEKCGFVPNALGTLAIELWDISVHLEILPAGGAFYPAIDQQQAEGKPQNVSLQNISYLHQLQNLYFSLTNTELIWD